MRKPRSSPRLFVSGRTLWLCVGLCAPLAGADVARAQEIKADAAAPTAPVVATNEAPETNTTPGVAAPIVAVAAPLAPATAVPAPAGDARETRRLQTEARLRDVLARCGITTTSAQDAVLSYLAADESARAVVRDGAKALIGAVRRGAPPERIKNLIGNYKTALETEKVRRQKAQITLDAQIGYSLDARLEAILWLAGLLGDGQNAINLSALFPRLTAPASELVKSPVGAQQYGAPGGANQSRPSVYGAANASWVWGTVMNKGDQSQGEMWIEIRSDAGRSERFWPLWKGGGNGSFAAPMVLAIAGTPLGARVRFVAQWQERARLLALETLGDAAPNDTAPLITPANNEPPATDEPATAPATPVQP